MAAIPATIAAHRPYPPVDTRPAAPRNGVTDGLAGVVPLPPPTEEGLCGVDAPGAPAVGAAPAAPDGVLAGTKPTF